MLRGYSKREIILSHVDKGKCPWCGELLWVKLDVTYWRDKDVNPEVVSIEKRLHEWEVTIVSGGKKINCLTLNTQTEADESVKRFKEYFPSCEVEVKKVE